MSTVWKPDDGSLWDCFARLIAALETRQFSNDINARFGRFLSWCNTVLENGGAQGTKLELSERDLILTELEEWTSVLKSEPEVIHRSSEIAARGAEEGLDSNLSVVTALLHKSVDG